MAETHGVSVRTLRNWMRLDSEAQVAPPGRPRTRPELLEEARALCRQELARQGIDAGEEPIWRALGGQVPRARVRRVLRELKAERRQSARQQARAARVSLRVRARDALWSMDATHLGRDLVGQEVSAEVVREVCSTRSIGLSVGPPASGGEVAELLQRTATERGGAPLALLTDNGGSYRSAPVEAWCAANGVLHIFTLPHTPQHNAASEHGMHGLKRNAGLGKGAVVLDLAEARARLEAARARVDGNRLRRTRGWRTALEADRAAPHWSLLATREEVLERAACAIRRALLYCPGRRARRRATRDALLATLEDFALITRTRGGRPWKAHDTEDVS